MSTRSTTHFTHASTTKPVAIIYRHPDGYPEGAGVDLLAFLDRCATLKDPRFSDPSYLAAKYVVFLAEMFAVDYDWKNGGKTTPTKDRLDFISVGVMDRDPGDIEYRYVVECSNAGRPKVTCYEVSETWDREKRKDKPMSQWKLTEVPIPEKAA